MGKVIAVLSGGGMKGMAHIGVLRALEEMGLEIDEYIGTSMGSVLAAMAAGGMTSQEMEKVALSIRKRDFFPSKWGMMRQLWNNATGNRRPGCGGVFNAHNFHQFLERSLPVDRFGDLPKPLFVNSINIRTSANVFWGLPGLDEIPIHEAVLSSCSLPGIFPPREINGEHYVDGGVGDNLPIGMAEHRGADLIIAVTLGFRGASEGFHSTGMRGLMGGFKEILSATIRQSSISIRDKVESSLHFCKTPLVLIEVDVSEVDMFDFSGIGRLIDRGRRVAEEIISSNPQILREVHSDDPGRWDHQHFSKAKFVLDLDRCIGCGLCVLACPYDIFRMDTTNNRAHLVVTNTEQCTLDKACENNCPTNVIKVL